MGRRDSYDEQAWSSQRCAPEEALRSPRVEQMVEKADHLFSFFPRQAELKTSRALSSKCLAVHLGRGNRQKKRREAEFCHLFFYKFTLAQFLATLTDLRVSTRRTYGCKRKDSKIT